MGNKERLKMADKELLKMADKERYHKNLNHFYYFSRLVKKQQILTSSATTAAKTTTIATKILLDDAHNGFKKGNFVFSPFSFEIPLGMLAAGATGRTLKELLGFLGHESMDQLLSCPSSNLFAWILSNKNGGHGSLDVSVANGVWVAKTSSPFQSSYKELLKTVYKTKPRFADFENKPNRSARKINSWVVKKTRGLIPTIVETSDLRDAVIVLANALYFKGSWSKPFSRNQTKMKDFHLINGETVSVPFMTTYSRFDYGSFIDVKILKIPYESEDQSNKFSMYIFLPDRKDGLQNMLKVIHSDHALFHTRFDLEQRKIDDLWIPKFKISYKFEPKDVMQEMGLILPFDPMNKELTRIIESTSPSEDLLYVSNILQKSFIEVDEKGTEATTCMSSTTKFGSRVYRPEISPPPVSFVADHPFMFMIREENSLAVFFVGVVLNPHD